MSPVTIAGPQSLGLVLSGGGARGAYEVGVLTHLARVHPELLPKIRIITGTSVGAVNAVFLASKGLTPRAVEELADLWRSLVLDRVLNVNGTSLVRMLGAAGVRLIASGASSPASGLLDASQLFRMVSRDVDWTGLHRQIRDGRFDIVSVTATDISSGRLHVFTESHRSDLPEQIGGADTKQVSLRPSHVMASAAIPVLFRPIKVDGRWYVDGGIRNNTPLEAAVQLGAHALIVVSVRTERPVPVRPDEFPGIGQVIGKVLDALFLDRLAVDIERLELINAAVTALENLGPAATRAVLHALKNRSGDEYRKVPYALVAPSEDLGQMAAARLEADQGTPTVFRRLLSLFEDDSRQNADAASFLLFDGRYATDLIEIGRKDAAAADDRFQEISAWLQR